jgi:hypothetical protein
MRNLFREFDRPLFGTVVIPGDARVDPEHFPEEDFPVHCPRCEYLLRGLAEERCPECGEPFDRGRLLVLQYAVRATKGWRSPEQRVLLCLGLAAALLVALTPLADYLMALLVSLSLRPRVYQVYYIVQRTISISLLVAILTGVAWAWRRWRQRARQRAMILALLQGASTTLSK